MALQLAAYTFHDLPVPSAYLKLTEVSIQRGVFTDVNEPLRDAALVSFAIYPSKAARDAGEPPLDEQLISITDTADATPFSSAFTAAPQTASSPMAALYQQAYNALATHPTTASLVANSTAA